ncbi:ammonium transporter 1 member 4 [Quercus suber]|uniref:Ammonium transporter 1 member 4 n=1 Tax=Quercus suber TaxID=58331 RepID=A0AAW0L8J6_QUESU
MLLPLSDASDSRLFELVSMVVSYGGRWKVKVEQSCEILHWFQPNDSWASPTQADDLLFSSSVTNFAGSRVLHMFGGIAGLWVHLLKAHDWPIRPSKQVHDFMWS